MEFGTSTSSMNQENYCNSKQVSNNIYTLFDKNLHRINKNLKYVNEYFTPKFEQPIENHLDFTENKELSNSLNDKDNQTLNIYNEFHKITMNEIEIMRKTQVRKMLKKRASTREFKRCSSIVPNNKKNELMPSIRERLSISKIYTEDLLDHNDDQIKTRLSEEQTKFDQKTRNIRFALALQIAFSLLNDLKKLLCENPIPSQLLHEHMHNIILFEADVNKFNDISRNSNENDLLTLQLLIQKIKIYQTESVESTVNKVQLEYFSFKTDSHKNKEEKILSENLTPKINERNDKYENNIDNINNKSEELKNDIHNFTFKMNQNSEAKSDLSSFTFKTGEKAVNDCISNFSFKTNDVKQEEIKNNNFYNFEDDYQQFLENHLAIQKYLNKIEDSYASFLHDDNFKSLRQELTKSINTPVNSISSVSPWHLKDKYDKLDALLKCKTVKTGNSTVSTNSHPHALIFCKNTLAKKIINMGEQVASVKTESAFEVASIVTELWQVHPDFGILLYARFKQKCPCLIPYNAAKTNEETSEEYYKSLGYNYVDGVVEKQDKYVKRMTGIIRLFAAIIVTESKSGKALGIGQAWMLIAATVNLVPQLDITAVLLHEMLLITGYYLKQMYGRQFIKMLKFIDTNYMKKIEEVTPVGRGGPVQRLKTFISTVIQNGFIHKPKGIIPFNFW